MTFRKQHRMNMLTLFTRVYMSMSTLFSPPLCAPNSLIHSIIYILLYYYIYMEIQDVYMFTWGSDIKISKIKSQKSCLQQKRGKTCKHVNKSENPVLTHCVLKAMSVYTQCKQMSTSVNMFTQRVFFQVFSKNGGELYALTFTC